MTFKVTGHIGSGPSCISFDQGGFATKEEAWAFGKQWTKEHEPTESHAGVYVDWEGPWKWELQGEGLRSVPKVDDK